MTMMMGDAPTKRMSVKWCTSWSLVEWTVDPVVAASGTLDQPVATSGTLDPLVATSGTLDPLVMTSKTVDLAADLVRVDGDVGTSCCLTSWPTRRCFLLR